MNGWKTYISAAALAVLGIVDIYNGDTEPGVQKLIRALALVGIGHKLDKAITASPLPVNDNTGV